MGLFSTRNNDGASGTGEPVNTIPAAAVNLLRNEAARHGCDTVGELITAPGPRGRAFGDEMPSNKASSN